MNNNSESILANMTEQELSAINKRLVYLRQNILQMTQSQFCDAVKISQTYLSLLENGQRKIKIQIILKISSALKINLDWLIYGIGNDDNIFQSNDYSKEIFTRSSQEEALTNLQKAFSLKESDKNFLSWYLALSQKERAALFKSLEIIKHLP